MKEGTLVICIDDNNWDPMVFVKMSTVPEKGKIYKVRKYFPPMPELDCGPGIALEGIWGEQGYFISEDGRYVITMEYHFSLSRFGALSEYMSPAEIVALFTENDRLN